MQKVGYFDSLYLGPGLSNDGLSVKEGEGQLILPCEIYHSAEKKLTFFLLRGSVGAGKTRLFGEELVKFYRESGFSNVVVLTSTMSPIKRERETNRQ